VEGLCSSWDGIAANDLTPRGESEPVSSYAVFGNSFAVHADDETEE
jgi:hypothetical protein